MAEEQVLTVKQVAEYFQVTEKTIYKLSQSGDLPGFKVGGSWRFKKDDIDKWIENNMNKELGVDVGNEDDEG